MFASIDNFLEHLIVVKAVEKSKNVDTKLHSSWASFFHTTTLDTTKVSRASGGLRPSFMRDKANEVGSMEVRSCPMAGLGAEFP